MLLITSYHDSAHEWQRDRIKRLIFLPASAEL